MNKHDAFLLLVVLLVVIVIFLLFYKKEEGAKKALVYYDNDLQLTIDLENPPQQFYEVTGKNGKVILETAPGKIRVAEEKSPYHLCSQQGWIKESYETIVCLPNHITVKIEAQSEMDAIVK